MKLLNLQSFVHGYLCLGQNHSSGSRHHSSDKEKEAAPVVKVIKSGGVVDIYRRAIKASELVMQFPNHLVCHSNSFYIGQKITPLSPDDQLQLGNNYFLLPLHFFESVLSFVSMASSFASFNNNNSSPSPSPMNKAIGSCQAFDIIKAPSGYLQIRVSDEFVSKLMQQQPPAEEMDIIITKGQEQEERHLDLVTPKQALLLTGKICSTAQLQKDYTQLVSHHRRQWKPKLETIKESKRRKLSSSSFGIKRRKTTQPKPKPKPKPKKSTSAATHKSKHHHVHDHHQKQKSTKVKTKGKKDKAAL